VVLPMDTTLDLAHFDPHTVASSYLKVTISKLYRITGSTAQMSGVKPDVLLPDPPEAQTQRESDEPFVLPPTPIAANKYYTALPALPVVAEQAIAAQVMSGSDYFKGAVPAAQPGKKVLRDYSLNLDEIVAEKRAALAVDGGKKEDREEVTNTLFTVSSPAYENQRLQADATLKEANEERKKDVLYDPYLLVAYQLVVGMIK
jgi:carboxyl-terminal processing protease